MRCDGCVQVAVAGAPVTSWQLYDTGYTERYLDRPSAKPNGYKLGSILNFVGQLPDEEGRLLIMHGTMDENVHFMQHTAQLINLLIKHGKPYQLQVQLPVSEFSSIRLLLLPLFHRVDHEHHICRSTLGSVIVCGTQTPTNTT